ncbi:unnamed protein product [Psylliodes chrysocephalus]|uniref:Sodium channel protein Nach n=1 Tax=Psylliodes chrysocephalus TaxID=3402493 RepID=A0A9P0CHH7_9CUCU|nr:unnamed protein product [Psylliodes chrysocephala]
MNIISQNSNKNEKSSYYKKTFEEFISNSSLAGFVHLGAKHRLERYVWYLVHMFSLGGTLYLMIYTWNNFMKNPTVTTVEAIGSKNIERPMPGISICSLNKISRKKAEKYAQHLSTISGVPRDDIMKNISLLGYLYEYNIPPNPEQIIHFQNFLEKYDSTPNGYYNTTERLYQLQPTCEELLTECKWQGRFKNCSDLFVTELTMDGYCCVFNYVSQRSTVKISPVVIENNYKPIEFGTRSILKFTIQSNSSDTFFTTLATEAPVKILISLATDFPDTVSGGLTEKILDKGTEKILRIASVKTITTAEVKKYPITKRKCLFRDEVHTIFGSYSYSNCIMECKISSIVALCQCIPYNFVTVYENENNQYFQCTLADLTCLNSYSNKWMTLFPTDYEGNELEREKLDSIHCSHCVPSCSDDRYDVGQEQILVSFM